MNLKTINRHQNQKTGLQIIDCYNSKLFRANDNTALGRSNRMPTLNVNGGIGDAVLLVLISSRLSLNTSNNRGSETLSRSKNFFEFRRKLF